ncbi:hypothetical protein [Pseudonocardia sp. TRM90224]|uniref:hypothetical protein n=1 Tax=Pseudonocardia sp. TRM90224 TaxID=2812678 RepID=UPI001E306FB4|nr:hypothetical protein [Pseudonocardia sp. TRM90224]
MTSERRMMRVAASVAAVFTAALLLGTGLQSVNVGLPTQGTVFHQAVPEQADCCRRGDS